MALNEQLVVGFGEIGKAVHKVFRTIYRVDWIDIDKEELTKDARYKAMHVCLPYTDNFINIVNSYIC